MIKLRLRYKSLLILAIVLIVDSSRLAAQFSFRVTGTVRGKENGTLAFVESLAPLACIEVPFKNGQFAYEGQVVDFKFYNIALIENVNEGQIKLCPFILEPGTSNIEIVIDASSVPASLDVRFTRVGELNELLLKYIRIQEHFAQKQDEARNTSNRKVIKTLYNIHSDSLKKLLLDNSDNVLGLFLVYYNSSRFSSDEIQTVLSTLPIPLRESKYYKLASSRLAGRSENAVGDIVNNFCLPDKEGSQICLSDIVSKNKYVLLEFWGSWCGPCILRAREIIPIYEKYKNKGFDIYGIALEVRKENWLNAIDKEGYEWTNVLELENDIVGAVCISKFLNPDGKKPYNILLNGKGKIVAKDLRPAELERALSKGDNSPMVVLTR